MHSTLQKGRATVKERVLQPVQFHAGMGAGVEIAGEWSTAMIAISHPSTGIPSPRVPGAGDDTDYTPSSATLSPWCCLH